MSDVEKSSTFFRNLTASPNSAAERTELDRAVTRAAYFSLFSIPDPASPSRAIPLLPFVPQLATGFLVNEDLHRFEVRMPSISPMCGLRVREVMGTEHVARVRMQMTPMPNNFEAAVDRVPPPTILLPFLSQRFCPLNGTFEFFDGRGSGFRAFGTGRTFPATVNGRSQTRLAAVVEITEAFGGLSGLQGTGIVNGEIQPPGGFAFNVLFRIADPEGRLEGRCAVPALQTGSDPTPETVFIPFLSEPDPDCPITLTACADGRYALVKIAEQLRLVEIDFSVKDGVVSKTTVGPVVGRHRATLILERQPSSAIIPTYSKGDSFSFFDKDGTSIGGFKADLFEARIFPTILGKGRTPIFRIGGFAPPTTGTGQFQNPVGMVSANGAFSPATGSISILYMMRLSDPFRIFLPPASRWD